MEKIIFLFNRHKGRSREDFASHYVDNHAPLGARLTRCLLGYTVNLVAGEGIPEAITEHWPDAITEHWLDQATDLLTPDIAYATSEDFAAIVTDDRSLFHGMADLYIVTEETYPVPAAPLASPLAKETAETKLVWFFSDAASAPSPPKAARRVVDNLVGYRLVFTAQGRDKRPSDVGLIRMAWGPNLAAFGAEAAGALLVREYCFIAAPKWDAAG